MKREFIGKDLIKRKLEVSVDAAREINFYTIMDIFDYVWSDGVEKWASVETELVDELSYTWEEIDQAGGITQFNRSLKKRYGIIE